MACIKGSDSRHACPTETIQSRARVFFTCTSSTGLLRPGFEPAELPTIPKNPLSEAQPAAPSFAAGLHFNVALPAMGFGDATGIVHDLLFGSQRANTTSKLFLLDDVAPSYPTEDIRGCQVARLAGQSAPMGRIAAEVLASDTPTVFTCALPARELEALERAGVQVVPVFHSAPAASLDVAREFVRLRVRFAIAATPSVKDEMLSRGYGIPIVVLHHEPQRPAPTPEEATSERRIIRERHGIADSTLLIGMVGQFSAQKGYTRAVRVLSKLQECVPARLMILGGWDDETGSGRVAYTATCRQALELGTMPDVLVPGPVYPAEAYYSAFDVLLDTSIDGSESLPPLEAAKHGCPVVTTGGLQSTDIDEHVRAILKVTEGTVRILPSKSPDPDLVPRLWSLLGRYGAPAEVARASSLPATLIVTENLNVGGPQRSLVNLLGRMPHEVPLAVAVLESSYCSDFLRELESTGVLVFGLQMDLSLMARCERVLQIAERNWREDASFLERPSLAQICARKGTRS